MADGAKPDHARGVCDIVDCDDVASLAFRDEGGDGDLYVEVCAEHASSFDGFDSDYERVTHDSPYREPERVENHDCGGDLHVYDVGAGDGAADDETDDTAAAEVEHRVCTDCGYALLIEHTGDDSIRVREASRDISP